MNRRRTPAGVLAGLVIGVAIGGCTGTAGDASTGQAGMQASPARSGVVVFPEIEHAEGRRIDLTDARCDASKGSWSGSGTVRNSSDKATTYGVSFAVAEVDGGSVRGRAVALVDLRPGESKPVVKKDFLTATETGLRCVIMVVRGGKAASASVAVPSGGGTAR